MCVFIYNNTLALNVWSHSAWHLTIFTETEESVDGEAKKNSETSVHESDRDAESSLGSEDITEVIESNLEDKQEHTIDKTTKMPEGDSDGDMRKNNITVGNSEHGLEEESFYKVKNETKSEYEEEVIEGGSVESKHEEQSIDGNSTKVTYDGFDGNDETQIQGKWSNVDDDYERQDEISIKSEDKDGSLEDIPKKASQEENASINGIERQKSKFTRVIISFFHNLILRSQ